MYKATTKILYLADGRSWNPGDVVAINTVPSSVAQAWIAEGIVKEEVYELIEDEEIVEKPKRGRPPKEVKDD